MNPNLALMWHDYDLLKRKYSDFNERFGQYVANRLGLGPCPEIFYEEDPKISYLKLQAFFKKDEEDEHVDKEKSQECR